MIATIAALSLVCAVGTGPVLIGVPFDVLAPADAEPEPDDAASSGEDADPSDVTADDPEPEIEDERPKAEVPAKADDAPLTLDDIFGTDTPDADGEPESTAVTRPADVTPPASRITDDTPTKPKPSLRSKLAKQLTWNLRIVSSAYFAVHKTDQRRFERNENRIELRVAYKPNEHIEIVGDIEPVFFGVSQASTLGDLASRQMLVPFHVESRAAYVGIYDLVPNLDIKIGRQIVAWGTADKFNPTNNINPDDLEDRPLFTEPIANQMVVVDWAPLDDRLWFQGVYVPIFFPALLPPSAASALQDPRADVPFARQSDVNKIEAAQDLFDVNPGLVPTVTSRIKMPRYRFSDSQSAIKVAGSIRGAFDWSVSYYNGRHDIPTPIRAISTFKDQPTGEMGTPGCCVKSEVVLVYPRMQVVGADFTTSLPFLDDMGVWGEAALFIPVAHTLEIRFPLPQDVTPENGANNDPVDHVRGPTITKTPFVKATAGLDYTFGKHVYVQAQYIRGFIDEFGAEHLGNYVLLGSELSFLGRHLLFRLFGLADLPKGRGDASSYVVYPALQFKPPWGYATLELGSFFMLGPSDTKFGQKATGSSIVFAKVVGEF